MNKLSPTEKIETRNNKKILKATYFAIAVSIILSSVKFLNYFITGSVAIQASALDSLMDIAVSLANFITIKITQKKATRLFVNGFDKIAALVALFQVILIGLLSVYLIMECLEKFNQNVPLEKFGYGIMIIIFALFLNTLLVAYQSKVIKQTGSLVIKADMLHYKTDFFTNLTILVGFIFGHFMRIYWLDPLLGLIASVYLLFAVGSLLKTSIFSILDVNDKEKSLMIFNYLNKNQINISQEDVSVLFTGTKTKICLNLNQNELEHINIEDIKTMLQNYMKNSIITITLK